MIFVNTLIVGASAAGLAVAKCLKDKEIDYILIEKSDTIAVNWQKHYDGLHLHTSKSWSELPGKKYATDLPKYPPKKAVVNYFKEYAEENSIHPIYHTEMISCEKINGKWRVNTQHDSYECQNLVIATGMNHTPKMAHFKGLENYTGKILHSSEYKNGKEFSGKKVLVIGFGNSGCEQAICLHEHGAFPSMSVRSGVNVLPRDIFGMPILEASKFTKNLPAKIADFINKPIINFYIGDITKYGLKKHKYGPAEQLEKEKRVPLLDIGTLDLIKKGHITIYPDIENIQGKTIEFVDGRREDFDAIIMATGYDNSLKTFLEISEDHLRDLKHNPIQKQKFFGNDQRYFCGFYLSPNGMIHEIAHEAQYIAKDIAKKTVA